MAKKQAPRAPKTPKSLIEAELCDLLSGRPSARIQTEAPPFPHKFLVVRPHSGGVPILLKVEGSSAKIMMPDYVAGYLREYCSYLSGPVADLNVTFDICARVVKAWSYQRSDLAELPKSVAFKSDPDLCMCRLPFDPVTVTTMEELKVAAPTFAAMLAQVTSNADAFCQRIGSIFDLSADRKQAVWLSGPSDSGKSQFMWLVQELCGGSFGILQDLDTPYWKAPLVGKRVGIVPEANARFLRTADFKALTGDGTHSINQKHEKVYSAELKVLVFFSSNDEPEIPHDDALIDRVIDCRIARVPVESRLSEPELRARLTAEMQSIVGYCMGRFAALESPGRIPCDQDRLRDTVDRYEADFTDLFEHYFVCDPKEFVVRSRLWEIVDNHFGKDNAKKHHFKRVLKKRFFCEEKKHSFQTNRSGQLKRLYVYFGIRERTQEEQQFVNKSAEPKAEARVVEMRARPSRP